MRFRKEILVIALFTVLMSVLFPPWQEVSVDNHQLASRGYGLLIKAPAREWALSNIQLDWQRLTLTWVGVAAVTGIALLALSDPHVTSDAKTCKHPA